MEYDTHNWHELEEEVDELFLQADILAFQALEMIRLRANGGILDTCDSKKIQVPGTQTE